MRRLLNIKVWSMVFSALALAAFTVSAAPVLTASAADEGGDDESLTIALVVNNPPTTGTPYVDVQWQDPATGAWNNIDNWLVPFDQSQLGYVPNYVESKDFGTGPYRWVLFDKLGGKIIGTSATFNFPSSGDSDGTAVAQTSTITLP